MYKSKKPYLYGTGRRKSSVARVHLFPNGTGAITINGRDIDDYFGLDTLKMVVRQPLNTTGTVGKVDIVATVVGGGVAGQDVDEVRIAESIVDPHCKIYPCGQTPQYEAAGRRSVHGECLLSGHVHGPFFQETVVGGDGHSHIPQFPFAHGIEYAANIGDDVDAVSTLRQDHGERLIRLRVAVADGFAALIVDEIVDIPHHIVRGAGGDFAHGYDPRRGFRHEVQLHRAGRTRRGKHYLRLFRARDCEESR